VTDRIALALALAVIGLLVADFAVNGGEATLFLTRKLVVFVEFLAFWR